MSHDAVRLFYKLLSESDRHKNAYEALTTGWFGHKRSKVVAYASSLGFDFTENELRFIRMTNALFLGETMARKFGKHIDYISDLAPTLHPKKPYSENDFYDKQQRKVEGAVEAPKKKSDARHELKDGVCQRCGCSEVFINALQPSCR